MRFLSRDAAALLRAGKAAFRPQASDRERVLRSLARALGDDAVADERPSARPGTVSGSARLATRAGFFLGAVAVIAVGVAVVASHLGKRTPPPARVSFGEGSSATRPEPGAAPLPQASPPPPMNAWAAPSSTGGDRPREPPSPERSSAASPPRASAAPRRSGDSLAEEVRLLSRAERQLNDGDGEQALETLGEHERRFPKGALAEERVAARVEALCTLGRLADARADLARLMRVYPRSPHADAARRFCGLEPGEAP